MVNALPSRLENGSLVLDLQPNVNGDAERVDLVSGLPKMFFVHCIGEYVIE